MMLSNSKTKTEMIKTKNNLEYVMKILWGINQQMVTITLKCIALSLLRVLKEPSTISKNICAHEIEHRIEGKTQIMKITLGIDALRSV